MALTRSYGAGREQCFQQVDKLIKSHTLRSSGSLCRLLRYLAEHALDHPGTTLKEYQIATEVLGRSGGFDPQSDSTVRVQAGRLRLKLEEYYSHEAPQDSVVVELPKGSYALTFHVRTPPPSASLAEVRARSASPDRRRTSNRGWAIAVVALSVLLAAALLTNGLLFAGRGWPQLRAKESVPAVFPIFWSRFVGGPQQPWVIFSNGNFVGRPETGMRYFNASADSQALILDHYTGVGEVLAVHQLDHVFVLLNRQLRVKRGSLFSLDDAKNNDLIFVGSPAENLTLLEIPGSQEFVFQRLTTGPRKGDLGVLNVHPQAGESQVFLGSPANQATTEDYAVIALVPGIDPARTVLILAGTTTFGTQAAAEYVCRQDSLAELLRRLGVSKAADLKPFEALLHVRVAHGVPVITDLVAVRKRS
ncbi:MAG: helix-turn-helix domain-containing protein [Candidatus Sulfotelmatobacter sp.]